MGQLAFMGLERQTLKEIPMKQYLVAAALIVSFASPTLAADTFYVMFDKKAKKCSVSKSAVTPSEQFSMMGQYGSEAEAMTAMSKMAECKG
jgi:hypothetical protein